MAGRVKFISIWWGCKRFSSVDGEDTACLAAREKETLWQLEPSLFFKHRGANLTLALHESSIGVHNLAWHDNLLCCCHKESVLSILGSLF